MVWGYDENGEKIIFNYDRKIWEYEDGNPFMICISGVKKSVCEKCNKPRVDMNGVKDCDFCLQSLTVCDFIDNACCGHGDDDCAYISFKDGRRWVLDKDYSF